MAFSQITLKISQDTARNIPVRPFASILQQTFAETLHIVREFMEMTDAPCTTMGRDHRRKLGVRALVLLKKSRAFSYGFLGNPKNQRFFCRMWES